MCNGTAVGFYSGGQTTAYILEEPLRRGFCKGAPDACFPGKFSDLASIYWRFLRSGVTVYVDAVKNKI